MRIIKNRVFIAAICLIAAAGLAFVVIPAMNRSNEEVVKVLRIVSPVAKGETIHESDIETVDMFAMNLPGGILSNQEDVIGKVAAKGFSKGDFIFYDKVSESTFGSVLDEVMAKKQNLVTVTVQTPASGLSGHLIAGDIVSIACYMDQFETVTYEGVTISDAKAVIYPELTELTVYAVENAQTESVEAQRDKKGQEDTGTTVDTIPKLVTLIVTPEQAVKLVEVEYSGKLHVVFERRNAE